MRLKPILLAMGGVLAVAFLVWRVGFADFLSTLARASLPTLALGAAAYGGYFVLRGWRWRMLLAPIAPDFRVATATGLTAAGWLLNSLLPMKAGDIARAAEVSRRTPASFAASVGSVAVERAFDVAGIALAALLALIPAGLALGDELPVSLERAVAIAWLLPAVAILGFVIATRILEKRNPKHFVVRVVRDFTRAFGELRRNPLRLVGVVALTVALSAAQIAVFVFIFLAFDPQAPLALVVAGVPFFLLSFAVSVTPGNVGTYEAAFVAVFSLVGFPLDLLVPLSVATHLVTSVIVGVAGGVAFLSLGLSPAMARKGAATWS